MLFRKLSFLSLFFFELSLASFDLQTLARGCIRETNTPAQTRRARARPDTCMPSRTPGPAHTLPLSLSLMYAWLHCFGVHKTSGTPSISTPWLVPSLPRSHSLFQVLVVALLRRQQNRRVALCGVIDGVGQEIRQLLRTLQRRRVGLDA